jgi:hypothetical protein
MVAGLLSDLASGNFQEECCRGLGETWVTEACGVVQEGLW